MVDNGRLTSAQRAALDVEVRKAEQLCRSEFSIFVGTADGDPRAFATSLHNSLVAPSRSILILVDPAARVVEVVTGGYVRRHLSDGAVDLAVHAMTTCFADHDLVGGLRRGVRMLAEHARPSNTLHASAG